MFDRSYDKPEPGRDEVNALEGITVLEFGADWCPHCQAAQEAIESVLAPTPIRHIKVADGKGKPLGRSFQVKLWPTVIVMQNGSEVGRAVRPTTVEEVQSALSAATGSSS